MELSLRLYNEWTANPQYAYGWSVPFLAGYLFWRRWKHRPEPRSPRFVRSALWLLGAAALVLLPLRIIATSNPDWRLLAWGTALTITLISFCALYIAGGVAWAKHFAYPILFFLVSVPWPAQLEQMVVQQLMRTVASIDVELLNLFGVTALQRGNVIELTSGLLGVEDACSGIRSLQSTFMLSLFFGEFYSLTQVAASDSRSRGRRTGLHLQSRRARSFWDGSSRIKVSPRFHAGTIPPVSAFSPRAFARCG